MAVSSVSTPTDRQYAGFGARPQRNSPSKILGLLFLTLIVLVPAAHAAVPVDGSYTVAWAKDYTPYGLQAGYNQTTQHAAGFVPLADGSFAIVGDTTSNGGEVWKSTNNSLFVLRADSHGYVLSDSTSAERLGKYLAPAPDGGYFLADNHYNLIYSSLNPAPDNATLFRLYRVDDSGRTTWEKNVTKENFGLANFTLVSVQQTSDHGYVVLVNRIRDSLPDFLQPNQVWMGDIWLVKLDQNGKVAWKTQVTGKFDQQASNVVQTGDGGYLITGKTTSFSSETGDLWDDFTATYHGNLSTEGSGFYSTNPEVINLLDTPTPTPRPAPGAQKKYYYLDNPFVDDYRVLVAKVDGKGNLAWTKTFDTPGYGEGVAATQAADGGYAITGNQFTGKQMDTSIYYVSAYNGSKYTVTEPRNLYDQYLLRLDAGGNEVWERTLPYTTYPDRFKARSIYALEGGFVTLSQYTTDYSAWGYDVEVLNGTDPYVQGKTGPVFNVTSRLLFRTLDEKGNIQAEDVVLAGGEVTDVKPFPTGGFGILTSRPWVADTLFTRVGGQEVTTAAPAAVGSGTNWLPLLVIVLIVLLIAGFGGYLYLKKRKT